MAGSRTSPRETPPLCRRYVALPLTKPDNALQSALNLHAAAKSATSDPHAPRIFTTTHLHLTINQMQSTMTEKDWVEHVILPAFIILIWLILLENL